MIKIKLMRKTRYNPHTIDINFAINIDIYYPESIPTVRCLTNVNFSIISVHSSNIIRWAKSPVLDYSSQLDKGVYSC